MYLLSLPALGLLASSNSQEFRYIYDSSGGYIGTYGNVTDIYEPAIDANGTVKPRTHVTYGPTGSHVIKVENGFGTAEKRTVWYDWYNNGAAQAAAEVVEAVAACAGFC